MCGVFRLSLRKHRVDTRALLRTVLASTGARAVPRAVTPCRVVGRGGATGGSWTRRAAHAPATGDATREGGVAPVAGAATRGPRATSRGTDTGSWCLGP